MRASWKSIHTRRPSCAIRLRLWKSRWQSTRGHDAISEASRWKPSATDARSSTDRSAPRNASRKCFQKKCSSHESFSKSNAMLEAGRALPALRGLALQAHQLVERLAVEVAQRVRIRAGDGRLQRLVAQVLQPDDAPRAVRLEDARHRHAPAGQQAVHDHERRGRVVEGLRVQGDHGRRAPSCTRK